MHNRITHHMLVDEVVWLADRLDLLVLVLVDVLEKVQLSQEGLVLDLDFLELEDDTLLGLDLTLVEHYASVLI